MFALCIISLCIMYSILYSLSLIILQYTICMVSYGFVHLHDLLFLDVFMLFLEMMFMLFLDLFQEDYSIIITFIG